MDLGSNTINVEHVGPITVKTDRRAGGWCEISVSVDPVAYGPKDCVAVVCHPCSGAKWFVHDRNTGARGVPFKTRKAATDAAIAAAKDTDAYKLHTKGWV